VSSKNAGGDRARAIGYAALLALTIPNRIRRGSEIQRYDRARQIGDALDRAVAEDRFTLHPTKGWRGAPAVLFRKGPNRRPKRRRS
jgi:hypothetical protein